MQVDGHGHFFGPNQLNDSKGDFFSEGSIGSARISAVEIAGFRAGKFLTGSGVNIDIRVWPLVDRIGSAGTKPESALSRSGFQSEKLRCSFGIIGMGKATVVSAWNDDQTALAWFGVLDQQQCTEKGGGFIGMGSPQNQYGAAWLSTIQNVDGGISSGPLQLGKIVRQIFDCRDTWTLANRLIVVHAAQFHCGCANDQYNEN